MRPWSCAAPGGLCTHLCHAPPGHPAPTPRTKSVLEAPSAGPRAAWHSKKVQHGQSLADLHQLPVGVPVPFPINPQCTQWAPDLAPPGTRLLLGPSPGAALVKGSRVRAGMGSTGMDRRCLVLSQTLLVAGMVRIGSAGADRH